MCRAARLAKDSSDASSVLRACKESLHYTPEHCLDGGFLFILVEKQHVSNGQHVSFKEPCVVVVAHDVGYACGHCSEQNAPKLSQLDLSLRLTTLNCGSRIKRILLEARIHRGS